MRPYLDLTYRGQARRLRPLALAALRHYPFTVTGLRLVNHGENTTFHATLTHRRRTTGALVRIHRPGYQEPRTIRSELTWLEALGGQTALTVPRPIRNRAGETVTTATAPGVPEPRHVVLFEWIPGRFLDRSLGPGALAQVGRMTATLHDHATRWTPPTGFVRQVWDAEGLVGPGGNWGSLFARGRIRRPHREILEAGIDRVRAILDDLGKGPEVYGLIHADLHHGNYLFAGPRAVPIDFDDCGYGYHLYDLAVTTSAVSRREDRAALEAALVRGYREVRPLSDAHVARLESFRQARRFAISGWILSRSDNPNLRKRARGLVPWLAKATRRWLDTDPR